AARAAARERRAARHADQQQLEAERLGVTRTRWRDETDAPVPADYQTRRQPDAAPAAVKARWKSETAQPFPEAYRLRKQRKRKPNEISTRWRAEARKATDTQDDAAIRTPGTERRRASDMWAKWQGLPVGAASGYDDGVVWRATKYGDIGVGTGDFASFDTNASDGSRFALDGLSDGGLRQETPAAGEPATVHADKPADGGVRRIQPTSAQLADPDVRAEILAFTEFVQSHGKPGTDGTDRFTFEALGITVSVFEDIVLVLGDEEIPVRFPNASKAEKPTPPADLLPAADGPSIADGTHGLLDDNAMFSAEEDRGGPALPNAPRAAATPARRTYDVAIPEAEPALTVAFRGNATQTQIDVGESSDNPHVFAVRATAGSHTMTLRRGPRPAPEVPIAPAGFDTFTVKPAQDGDAAVPAGTAGDTITIRRPSSDGRGAGSRRIAVHGRPRIRTRGT
ncbi:MAG: hypothetical protein MI806_06705, partial [Minwuiales bacterium]|nr:hypothetical protein [Minwuiales bacterium]